MGFIFVKSKKTLSYLFLGFSIGVCFSLYYHISYKAQEKSLITFIQSKPRNITGTVSLGAKAGYTNLTLDNGLTLLVKTGDKEYFPGEILKLSGTYLAPQKPRNPGGINSYRYAVIQNSAGYFHAKKIKKIDEKPALISKLAYQTKKHIVNRHKENLPEGYSDLYSALIFGEMLTSIPKEFKVSFIKSGLLHALVVSGSQVSLILSCLHRLLNFFRIFRFYQFIVLIPAGAFFYIITGGGASVFRALLMTLILLTMKYVIRYKTTPLHILSLSAAIMMILDPLVITNLGALLSFTVTSSLLFGVPSFEKQLPERWPKLIKQSLCMGIVPWLWSFPILAVSMHAVSISSIVVNIICAVFIEYTVIIGFFSTCLGFIIPLFSQIIDQLSYLMLLGIVNLSLYFAKIPLSMIHIPKISPILFITFLGLILITLKNLKLNHYRLISVSLTLILFTSVNILALQQEKLIITFLDVGQGDSCLIEYKNFTVLIDTGNDFSPPFGNICNNVLLPALKIKGIHHLDLVIISHFDKDHMGALSELASEISIGTLIHNGDLKHYPDLEKQLTELSINLQAQSSPATLTLDALQLVFLTTHHHHFADKNNKSLILKLLYNDYSFLFTGDIEQEAESVLSSTYKKKLHSQVLKVAHHGSKTSSTPEFLLYASPQISIISVGLNNRYHHPNPTIEKRLQHYGKTYRTDQLGAIEFTLTDKVTLKHYSN